MNDRVDNPLARQGEEKRGAMVEQDSQRAIQEVQAAMVIAKRFPRDQIEATERLINACTRQSLAESALYSYVRGGSDVTGPSIRLAETAAQCWGNIQFGIRELEQSSKESVVEAFAWDLETNTRQTKVFQVPHMRHTRKGAYKLTDPRDIYENVANQGARRLRACILGVIPGDVIEAAQMQCEETMKANADTSPEAIKKMVGIFKDRFGVSEELIVKRLGVKLDAIRPAQVVALRKIYQSLSDGMSKPSDWFETGDPSARSTTIDEITGKGEEKAKPEKAAMLRQLIDEAGTIGELEGISQEVYSSGDADLRKAYKAKKVELEMQTGESDE